MKKYSCIERSYGWQVIDEVGNLICENINGGSDGGEADAKRIVDSLNAFQLVNDPKAAIECLREIASQVNDGNSIKITLFNIYGTFIKNLFNRTVDILIKTIKYNNGPLTYKADGDPNKYIIFRGNNWFMAVQQNGEMHVGEQEDNMKVMCAAPEMVVLLKRWHSEFSSENDADNVGLKQVYNLTHKLLYEDNN